MRAPSRIGLTGLVGFALGALAAWPLGLLGAPAPAAESPDDCTGAAGCRALAMRLAAAHDDAGSEQAMEHACTFGDGPACLEAARALDHTRDGHHDIVATAALLERGCTLDDGEACTELARRTGTGDGVPRNAPRAVELADRACRLSSATGCYRLAQAYEEGNGANVDLGKARAAQERACDLGHAQTCDELGTNLISASTPADPLRGLALMTRACNLDPVRCYNLGVAVRTGVDAPADVTRAASLFRKACDADSAPGCLGLAEALLQTPELVPGPSPTPAELLRRACNGGLEEACNKLDVLSSQPGAN